MLDEPFSALDPATRASLQGWLREESRREGLTSVIVTHDIAVGRKTDRIIRMLDGSVVEEQQLEVPRVLASNAA